MQFEDKAGSPDPIAVPVLEALSVGTDEGESPLTVSLAGSDGSGFGAGVCLGLAAT